MIEQWESDNGPEWMSPDWGNMMVDARLLWTVSEDGVVGLFQVEEG